jgi:hypothetical protein
MKCGFIYELRTNNYCQFIRESHTAGGTSLVNFLFHMLFFFYADKTISVKKIGRDIHSQLSESDAIK